MPSDSEDIWILDSGASAHMCYKRELFAELNQCEKFSVTLGNNKELLVTGKGVILINTLVNNQWINSRLTDVWYVPELKKNLFAEGILTKKNMKIIKEGDSAKVYENGKLVLCAVRTENNLYKVLLKTIKNEANLVTNDIKTWHERLGHINIKTLREMINKNLVEGVKVDCFDKFFCEACVYGKQHRRPFTKVTTGSVKNGDTVYSDLCGPMEVPSIAGARYFITFTDGYSNFRIVKFLKNKSDALNAFKDYVNMLEKQFNIKVKKLHTDNGLEYCNESFQNYAASQGIQLETTAPYTPQQNGRSERSNRTIMESARSMMCAKKLPRYLWAEAVNTAVYILNRTPYKGQTTP